MTTAALIDMPYLVQRADDDLTVILAAEAGDHPALARDDLADFADLGSAQVIVDARSVQQMNSVLICWLVRLANHVGKQRLTLRNMTPRARALLARMRLDQVMTLA